MGPTEQLREEHKAIKLALRILEAFCKRLESSEGVDPDDLDRTVEFIQVFADRCHHGKEEDLLFPAMEEAGIPREGGPIGVMLAEHDMGRSYVRAMAKAVGDYRAGDGKAPALFVENARNYISLLAQHIDKEDFILFPMAEGHLSREKQDELLQGFELVERERIGPGKHEEFHELLHRLEETYLK